MKKNIALAVAALFAAAVCFPQTAPLKPEIEGHIGLAIPWGPGIGVEGGAAYIVPIDRMFNIGVQMNLFYKQYNTQASNTGTNIIAGAALERQLSVFIVPVYALARIDIPLPNVTWIEPFVQVMAGYTSLFNNIVSTASNQSGVFYFGSFSWTAEGGVSFPLGERTRIGVHAGWNFGFPATRISKSSTFDNVGIEAIEISGFYCNVGVSVSL
ncbi:MAG: hypothetical protein HZC28_10220 [Spirochaetes bacterium]|nr:hypothetical protein [Spirochaetota bacterium]